MPTQPASHGAVVKIVVRIEVGSDRMAATDDPMFLSLRGPSGREFRLAPSSGKSFRRGQTDVFVLGSPSDSETNIANPELNDPSTAGLQAERLQSIVLYKGMEPIPNVRGVGEMDDRVEISAARVELHRADGSDPVCFERSQPFWLGLACGLAIDLEPVR